MQLFARYPELDGLNAARRKAAYRYAFCQVATEPTFYLGYLALALVAWAGSWIGGAAMDGPAGQFAGLAVGVVIGMLVNDRIMRRVLRPHLRRFLDGSAAG